VEKMRLSRGSDQPILTIRGFLVSFTLILKIVLWPRPERRIADSCLELTSSACDSTLAAIESRGNLPR